MTVATPTGLMSLGGEQLGTTNWIEITQDQVNMFATLPAIINGYTSIRCGPGPHPSAARSSTGI
jgi:hypothetical protein